MNIYITKENEQRLRSLPTDKSMSGIINDLLDKYWVGQGPDIFEEFAKNPKSTVSVSKQKAMYDIKTPKDVLKVVEPPIKNFLDKKKGLYK